MYRIGQTLILYLLSIPVKFFYATQPARQRSRLCLLKHLLDGDDRDLRGRNTCFGEQRTPFLPQPAHGEDMPVAAE